MGAHASSDQDDGEIEKFDGGLLFEGEVPEAAEPPDTIYIGSWSDYTVWGFFRFGLPADIPAGATIVDARVNLWGTTLQQWNTSTDRLRINAELTADASRPTSAPDAPSEPSGRTVTNAQVLWPPAGGLDWRVDDWNTSPNFAPVLQALVDQFGGVRGGSHVQLWISGDASGKSAEVGARDYQNGDGREARIEVIWR